MFTKWNINTSKLELYSNLSNLYQNLNIHFSYLNLIGLFLFFSCLLLAGHFHISQYNPDNISIASAVSTLYYGGNFGGVYLKLLERMLYHPENIQFVLSDIQINKKVMSGEFIGTAPDGAGISYCAFVFISMYLFGLNLLSLSWGYFLLLLAGVLVFLIRFKGRYGFIINTFFLCLLVFYFTETFHGSVINEYYFGGNRSFALIAVIPALHLYFDINERPLLYNRNIRCDLLSYVQVSLIALAVLIRSSAMYLVVTLLLVTGFRLFLIGKDYSLRLILVQSNLVRCMCLFSIISIIPGFLAPDPYLHEERVYPHAWHRLFISLGANPGWPFSGIENKTGLCLSDGSKLFQNESMSFKKGITDANGFCIFSKYVYSNNLPESTLAFKIYGGDYNKLMRDAFFRVTYFFPFEVTKTFFYYKPLLIYNTLLSLYNFSMPQATQFVGYLILGAMLIYFISILFCPANYVEIKETIIFVLVASVMSMFPLIVAWSNLFTTMDVFLQLNILIILLVLIFREYLVKTLVNRMLLPLKSGPP